MMASMQGIIVPRVLSTVVRCGVADSAGSLVPGGYSGVVMGKGTAVIISALTALR
jgi:hypothetical protein